MKKIILYSLLFAMIAPVALTSCEDAFGDFLDKQPSNELTEEQVFSDWNLLVQFHYDTYNFLRHGASRINGSWLDAATDLAQTSFYYGGTRTTFNIGNYYGWGGSSELTGTWEHYYRAIRKCNMTITRIESVPKEPSLSETQYEQDKWNYKSEARFLRAYFYWELFLRYGAIPIVEVVLDPDGDLLTRYVDRPTVKEYVVDFILEELKLCEPGLMKYDDAWNSSRAGRIGQPVARALYSRIMLYMASPRYSAESGITWQAAADAAESFIDDYGANFSLFTANDGFGNTLGVTAYTDALLRTAYQGSNKEVIFYRNDGTVGWNAIYTDTPVGEGGYGGNCPSQNLADMYDMADGLSPFTEYDATGAPVYNSATHVPEVDAASGYNDAAPWESRDPRLTATVLYNGADWGNGTINVILGQRDNPVGNTNATPTGYYVRKYIPESILSAEHSQSAYRLWTMIRYAEILLNYAEAMNESQGPSPEVYDALDAVRSRAGVGGSVQDRSDLTSSKDKMRNFIRKERTVELAFEEHRAWDVRRWNVAVEALSRPIYGINVGADGTVTRKLVQERVFGEKMYLYPIPEGEVWKTSIENNPGW